MRVLIVGVLPSSLLNFRGSLMQAMIAEGHSVWASSNGRDIKVEAELKKMGVHYCPIKISRTGRVPIKDVSTCFQIISLIRKVQPQVVLAYTVKPVIFGGIAAAICRVPNIYSMIEGLGYAFMEVSGFRHHLLNLTVRILYRISLIFSQKVFFLNPDDIALFVKKGIVTPGKTVLINGTGVDLAYYSLAPLKNTKDPVFLLIARLLADKGIREYISAAKQVKQFFPRAQFYLVGDFDSNPSAISKDEVKQWRADGTVEFLGYLQDVRYAISCASVYVLPSYREGTPRTVLEAMSMGRPVISTNVPGCRETVKMIPGQSLDRNSTDIIKGENGFLVPSKNVEKLVLAMKKFFDQPGLIEKMGKRSREIAEQIYDVHQVNAVLLQEMGLYDDENF